MYLRKPCAQNFYRGDNQMQIERFVEDYSPPGIDHPCAGIVPHAGWIYSGAIAAKVFACLKHYNQSSDTFICFGAVHGFVQQHSVDSSGAWWTPFGKLEIDEEFAEAILEEGKEFLTADSSVHRDEHSLEVQMPMIKYFFPDAKIVPIAAVPKDDVYQIGEIIGKAALRQSKKILFVGTTDLTHYGKPYGFTPKGIGEKAHQWAKQNDKLMLEKIKKMEIEKILGEAKTHFNACGPGAVTATLAAAKQIGHTHPVVLEHVTSHELKPEPVYQMSVGYAGIVI